MVQIAEPAVPASLRNLVEQFASVREQTDGADLSGDLHALLSLEEVRRYVDSSDSIIRRAVVAAMYIHAVWQRTATLFGRYVLWLMPEIARVIRPALRTLRVGRHNELAAALANHADPAAQLSALGPLAMFFLLTVARAKYAWDVLVDSAKSPRCVRSFGWPPGEKPLWVTLRFVLLGQAGRVFRRQAFLYSPFARYVLHLGLAQRVPANCQYQLDPVEPRRAGEVRRPASRSSSWLLSCDYITRSAPGQVARVWTDSTTRENSAMPQFHDLHADCRTGRCTPTPLEEMQSGETRETIRSAVRKLLMEYASPSRPQLKRLTLWACLAGADPLRLLREPQQYGEGLLMDLAHAILTSRLTRRSERLDGLNHRLEAMRQACGAKIARPFTAVQVGTTMTRLRQDYLEALKQACSPARP